MLARWQAGTSGLAVVLGVFGFAAPALAGPADSRATLEVVVLNHANVAPGVLQAAQHEASRIYANAGVDLVWLDASDGTLMAAPYRRLVIMLSRTAPEQKPNVLGYASRAEDKGGSVALAFVGRVTAFARAQRTEMSQVLGYVMAHEMGHLLLSFHSHTNAGIMRGAWRRGDVGPAGRDRMTFNEAQAEYIRGALTASAAN